MITVLLVEGDGVNLRLEKLLLERAGYRVVVAENAECTLDLARQYRPGLIILDIQIPGLDGLRVTRMLKKDRRTASIRIMAVIALAMTGDEARIRAAGCDDYVSKPFHCAAFLGAVEAAIAESQFAA